MTKKAIVKVAGQHVAANTSVAWKLQTGTQPYMGVFTVHKDVWDGQMKKEVGKDVKLEIKSGDGTSLTVSRLTILHDIPSDSPHRVSFLLADQRWRWPYKFIARDYNITKKTGDRTTRFNVPIENAVTVDEYEYRPYSLQEGKIRWTARSALKDLLEIVTDAEENRRRRRSAAAGGGHPGLPTYVIERFPIPEETEAQAGQYTLQNIVLRDQGDVAVARLLSYIPFASLYVDINGIARVIDAADFERAKGHFRSLPGSTWDGEAAREVDRKKIRPSKVLVHYQREVEVLLQYSDDYNPTQSTPNPDHPFVENVLPTVDPETVITSWDPEAKQTITRTVPPGTWVEVKDWLRAMDADKPNGSFPWTFETIRKQWLHGDLDGALGGRGKDLDEDGNVAMRIQALKQHFRQTFRINRRYIERVRDIQAIRVALLDPITGARAPASVWGQAAIVPTNKGKIMAARKNPEQAWLYRNVDFLAPSRLGLKDIIDTAPGPARVVFLDRDLGIFRVEWVHSPYGTVESFVPCHLVNARESPDSTARNLRYQDSMNMMPGSQVESGANGIFLRKTMQFKCLVTMIPAAPNNKRQFLTLEIEPKKIKEIFRKAFNIDKGEGPPLEIFIPPGEATARYALRFEFTGRDTIAKLLGLDKDDPNEAGIDADAVGNLPGYTLVNRDRELQGHSRAVAAEVLTAYADNFMGRVSTKLPTNLPLRGNMAGVTVMVSGFPHAKIQAMHDFPGQTKPISRMALLPESARHLMLGILPHGRGDG